MEDRWAKGLLGLTHRVAGLLAGEYDIDLTFVPDRLLATGRAVLASDERVSVQVRTVLRPGPVGNCQHGSVRIVASLTLRDCGRFARDTIRIIETPRYVPYWNGRSDGKSRPARGARSGGAAP